MTRRFLHTDPWSSLLDAWSEAYPRLRHTISVRDDRLPSKASRATRATQQRRSERGLLGRSRGPLLHLRVHRHPALLAPSVLRGTKIMHNPGASRRGIEGTHLVGWLKKGSRGSENSACPFPLHRPIRLIIRSGAR